MKTLLLCFAFLPVISLAQTYEGEEEQEQAAPINVECNCPAAPVPVQREESWEQEDRETLQKRQEELPGQSNDQFVDPIIEQMERYKE